MEPARDSDRLSGGVGLVVIALHDVRALGEDFAIRRDLELHAGHGLAHRAQLGAVEWIDRQHWGSLRQTVPLNDREPGGEEEPGDVDREPRTSGQEALNTAAA